MPACFINVRQKEAAITVWMFEPLYIGFYLDFVCCNFWFIQVRRMKTKIVHLKKSVYFRPKK